jgi:hypothetical protein
MFSVKSQDKTFVDRLSSGLHVMGADAQDADDLASEIARTSGPDCTLAQGLQKAANAYKSPKAIKPRSSGGVVVELPVDRFDGRPEDYRRAIAHAKHGNVTVLKQLKDFGMAPLLEDVLEI